MKYQKDFYSVHPSLIWNKGRKKGVVMHVAKSTFQQVPIGALNVLDYMSLKKTTKNELLNHFKKNKNTVLNYINYFIKKRWIIEIPEFVEYEQINITRPFFSLDNVFIELNEEFDLNWFDDILTWLRLNKNSMHIIIVLEKFQNHYIGDIQNILSVSSKLDIHSIGVWFKHDVLNSVTSTENTLTNSIDFYLVNSKVSIEKFQLKNKIINLPDDEVIDTHNFICNPYDSQRILNGTFGKSSLFFDSEKRVYSHPLDSKYLYGFSNNVAELKATLSNKKYLNFIGLKRSELDKCNQCEFNIVCTNPFYNRECNDDLYSAPNNCHYDPKLLIWK